MNLKGKERALLRLQREAASSGANLCPPEWGPYEWVEGDGAMVLVDSQGRPHMYASKESYEALKA